MIKACIALRKMCIYVYMPAHICVHVYIHMHVQKGIWPFNIKNRDIY